MGTVTDMMSALNDVDGTWQAFQRNEWEATRRLPEDEVLFVSASLSLLNPKHLETSTLLWISPQMVDLMLHAARTLPPYDFDPSLLPWPRAFVLAAKPLYMANATEETQGRDVPVVAVQWSDLYAHRSNGTFLINGLGRVHGRLLSPISVCTLQPGTRWDGLRGPQDMPREFGEVPANTNEIARVMCTLWLLVQQKVAVKRHAAASRPDQRRWARLHDAPIPDVTIIELRRPMSTPHQDSIVQPVEWSHRWIVDGHWRNQWHPSTGAHVPTWIAPHVKGPEDKPLVLKRKVNAWIR